MTCNFTNKEVEVSYSLTREPKDYEYWKKKGYTFFRTQLLDMGLQDFPLLA